MGVPSSTRGLGKKLITPRRITRQDLLCLGLVGKDKVCGAERIKKKGKLLDYCGVHESHKRKKWVMPAEAVWVVPAPARAVPPQPGFLRVPAVPEHMLLSAWADEIETPRDPLELIDYMNSALEGYEQYLVEGDDSGNEDDEGGEDSSARSTAGVISELEDHPTFVPRGQAEELPEFVYTHEAQPNTVNGAAITETRDCLAVVNTRAHSTAVAAEQLVLDSARHTADSFHRTISKINILAAALNELVALLGDLGDFTEAHDVGSLTDAVTLALRHLGGDADVTLSERVDELDRIIHEIDADLRDSLQETVVQSAVRAANALKLITDRVVSLEQAYTTPPPAVALGGGATGHQLASPPPLPPGGTLPLSTVLTDDSGAAVISLGDMLKELRVLREETSQLRSEVVAAGGVSFDRFSYASEETLKSLVMKELPSGDAIAAFVDPISIFAHDKTAPTIANADETVVKDELKALTEAGMTRSTDRRLVATFGHKISHLYSGKGEVTPGKKLAVFTTWERWVGVGGLDGHGASIKKHLRLAAMGAQAYIRNYLRPGELQNLAMAMVSNSELLHDRLHAHAHRETTRLTQQEISHDATMELVSEQTIIVFNKMFELRAFIYDFDADANLVDFVTRLIWVTLKCHMLIEKMLALGLDNDVSIASAFIRFLTKQTGSNSTASLASRISKLETSLKKDLDDTAKVAGQAHTVANGNRQALDHLFIDNKDLKQRGKKK